MGRRKVMRRRMRVVRLLRSSLTIIGLSVVDDEAGERLLGRNRNDDDGLDNNKTKKKGKKAGYFSDESDDDDD
jgi:hypothetical protein